jgi:hypothetical protein
MPEQTVLEQGVSQVLGINNVVNAESSGAGYLRAPDKPVADPAILSIVGNATLAEIGDVIGKHIVRWDDKPQIDQKNPNRLIMRVFLDNPHKKCFVGTPLYDRIEDKVMKEMTVEQVINAQFERLTYIAKQMENADNGIGHRAEFIKWPVPTSTGQVLLRAWAYNVEGYIVCEYKGYTNIRVAATVVGPARVAFVKDAQKDTGGYDPTTQMVASPKASVAQVAAEQITAAPATPAPVKGAIKTQAV